MGLKLKNKLRAIVSKVINDTVGDLAVTVTWKRYTGNIVDTSNPSKATPQFVTYTGIKGIMSSSVRGEASGALQLQVREGFRRSVDLLIAYDDLPFVATESDKPQTRDRFILEDLPYEWSVVELGPGDPIQATYKVVGQRQVD